MEYKIFHQWRHALTDELLTLKQGGGININSIVNNNVIVCDPHAVQPSSHMTNEHSVKNHNNAKRNTFNTSPSITNLQHPRKEVCDISPSITENSGWINQNGAFNNMNKMNCTPPAKNVFEPLFSDNESNDNVEIIEKTMAKVNNDKQIDQATPTL